MSMADLRRFCAVDGDAESGQRRELLEQHRAWVLARLERTWHELTLIDGKIAACRDAVTGGSRLGRVPMSSGSKCSARAYANTALAPGWATADARHRRRGET
jgi:hypothetical protein